MTCSCAAVLVCAATLTTTTAQPPPGMVHVPAGSYAPFLLEPPPNDGRTPASQTGQATPSRPVAAFYLDVHPVTKREYLVFVSANSKWRRSQVKRIFADPGYLKRWRGDLVFDGAADSPVTHVSWFAARAYCSSLGKRLPESDEWEYAAELGGDTAMKDRILTWYAQPTPRTLPPVGTVGPDKLGLVDMVGVIWEWTADFNSVVVSDESRGSSANSSGLFCGGAGLLLRDASDYANAMRFAFRSSLAGSYTTANLGFRCAKDIR